KWILRKAFEGFLPDEIIWQDKRPLEEGSGTKKLREVLTCAVSDEEWKEAKIKKQVMFLNKEHFYYYKIYKREIGKIPEPLPGEKTCPGCGAGLKKGGWHCRVCGWTEKIQEI
ncbi:hypothetical protein H5U35_08840, partial [Candidatus Aerophobetes bacterium]|nr:hypothetical protein [Candidatus Aerophobetes bacterium]